MFQLVTAYSMSIGIAIITICRILELYLSDPEPGETQESFNRDVCHLALFSSTIIIAVCFVIFKL